MESPAASLPREAATGGLRRRTRGLVIRGGSDWTLIAGIIASLAYYYAVPSPLLSLPGLVVFAALAWLRLDLALCLLPLTFPFWYVPKRVFGHTVFPLSEIALVVCVAVAIGYGARQFMRQVRERGPHTQPRWAYLYIPTWQDAVGATRARLGLSLARGAALFVAGTTIGVLVARRPHEALRAWRWEVVEPLVYLALVLLFARRRGAARLLIWSFLGSALLVATLAAVQVFWLHATFTPLADGNRLVPYATSSGGVPRATALIYGSGNSLGAWVGRALPLVVALVLARGDVSRRERWLAIVVGLACLPALVWSQSRGAELAAGIACVVVACLALRRPLLLVGAAAIGAVATLWDSAALLHTALAGHGSSGEVRTLVWLAALHMIRDHPLFGIGPDQFLYYYSSKYTNHPYWILMLNGHRTLAWREPDLAQPHNLLLDLWLSGGLLALAGFVIVLAAFWKRALALWQRGTGWTAAAAPGVGGAVLAGMLHGMVDNAYFAPDLALVFWWAIAVILLLKVPERRITS